MTASVSINCQHHYTRALADLGHSCLELYLRINVFKKCELTAIQPYWVGMEMDEVLCGIADDVKNFATVYLIDISEVPDFNTMYELYDPCTVMFFFRNKHIMIDLGTGNNNKINWAFNSKQEMIDIVETVYRGARKGRGLVISPKDYSTKYKY